MEAIIVAFALAALIGILLVWLLGPVLQKTAVPILTTLGDFFVKAGWILGVVLAIIWYFGGGGPILGFGKH